MSTVRIPVAAPLETREVAVSGTFQTDSMLINCYVESEQDGRKFVVKRPGLTSALTYNGGGLTSGQGTTYFNGSIYAMGSNVLYRLTGSANGSADGAAWGASTSAPWKARTNHVTITFNGQILVLGGINNTGAFNLNDVWASSDGVNWTQLVVAAPWAARRNFQCVVLGNTLYLMGGIGAATYNDVWSTTDGVSWSQVIATSTWSARSAFGAVPFNQGIVIMGGRDSAGGLLNDVWYSPDGATWTQLVQSAAWSARQSFCALVFNEKMWVAGGTTGTVLATVYSSSDGITWTNTGSLPAARRNALCAAYNGKMWFIGGTDNSAATQSTVYSTTDGTTFATPTSNYGGGSISSGGCVVWKIASSGINVPTMWLIGGTVSGTESNQIYKATINTAQPASYSPSTAAAVTDQWHATTQNAGQYLVFKNPSDAWVLYATTFQKITSPNYPASTVPGVVNLDDTVYVMDANGVIYGSNLSDPFTWSALNFITADYESDTGIAIAKYGQNIVALKSTTLQFFYDAGRFPGSPLLPIVSENRRVGCVSAATVVAFNDNLVWVGRTKQKGRFVAMLNGTMPTRVSTPDVDRILDAWTPSTQDRATGIRVNGHDFYLLTLVGSNITLAFDLSEKQWSVFQSADGFGLTFTASNYVTDGTTDYLQSTLSGILYSVSPVVYQDSGVAFTAQTTGLLVDNATNHRKFCGSLTVIGDRRSSSSPNNATVSWSDDDGQTYSSGYTVDLTKARPKVPRVGSFRRRRFRVSHSSNNPMRLEALELEIAS